MSHESVDKLFEKVLKVSKSFENATSYTAELENQFAAIRNEAINCDNEEVKKKAREIFLAKEEIEPEDDSSTEVVQEVPQHMSSVIQVVKGAVKNLGKALVKSTVAEAVYDTAKEQCSKFLDDKEKVEELREFLIKFPSGHKKDPNGSTEQATTSCNTNDARVLVKNIYESCLKNPSGE